MYDLINGILIVSFKYFKIVINVIIIKNFNFQLFGGFLKILIYYLITTYNYISDSNIWWTNIIIIAVQE